MSKDTKRKYAMIFPEGSSLTKQSFKDECDVNKIVDQFLKTGLVTHTNERQPQYGNVTDIPDYQEALNIVNKSQAQFMALPAKIRERFDNNPGKFLTWISNPENKDEAEKLGLLAKPEEIQKKGSKLPPEDQKSVPQEGNEKTPEKTPPPIEKQGK